jgi:hypothetical protein
MNHHSPLGSPWRQHSSTPWGESQTEQLLAPGIVCYTTAGHGGIHVFGDAHERMDPLLRSLPTFTHSTGEGAWYEEDVDWAIVAIAFPDAFSGQSLWHAERTIRMSRKDAAAWLDHTDPGRAVMQRLATWQAENPQLFYETTSKREPDGTWTACMHSVDGKSQCILKGLSSSEHWDAQSMLDLGQRFGDRAVVTARSLGGVEAAVKALAS